MADSGAFPTIEQQGFRTAKPRHTAPTDYLERNGSIERVGDGRYLLAFGKQRNDLYRTYMHVLDSEFNVLESAAPLPLPFSGSGAEDTRLIRHDGLTYCAYTDITLPNGDTKLNFTQSLCVLDPGFKFLKSIPLDYRGNFSAQWEKNWGFFFWNNRLHFVYSIPHHTVVEIDEDGTILNEYIMEKKLPDIYDKFAVHTGTPPKRLDDDHYIAFFHAWDNTGSWVVRGRVYRVSAYIFEARPPFRIVNVTRPLIYGSRLNTPGVNLAVLFPAGLIVERDRFLVSIGINDIETKIVEISKQHVMDQLIWA